MGGGHRGSTQVLTDYRSRRVPLSPSERTDLLRRLNDSIAQKYPGLLNTDLVLSSLAIRRKSDNRARERRLGACLSSLRS